VAAAENISRIHLPRITGRGSIGTECIRQNRALAQQTAAHAVGRERYPSKRSPYTPGIP